MKLRIIAFIVLLTLILSACGKARGKTPPAGDGRPTLVIATDNTSSELTGIVSNYDRELGECRISIKSYYDGELDAPMERLLTEIITGNAPDIFAFEFKDSYGGWNTDVFEDLLPYLEGEEGLERELFVPQLYEAMTAGGELLVLPWSFYIDTFIAPESLVGERDTLSLEEAEEICASMGEGYGMFGAWLSPGDALHWLLSASLAGFVDYESGTCDFRSQSFIDLLELCARQPAEPQGPMEDPESVANSLLEFRRMGPFGTIQGIHVHHGMDYSYVGVPSAGGSASSFGYNLAFMICSQSQHKDEAWRFIRSAFTDKLQASPKNGFPVLRSEYERQRELSLKGYVNQQDLDKLDRLLSSTTLVNYGMDLKIREIILDEAAVYFAGDRTAQEVAEIIESRVGIYLAERS